MRNSLRLTEDLPVFMSCAVTIQLEVFSHYCAEQSGDFLVFAQRRAIVLGSHRSRLRLRRTGTNILQNMNMS